MRQEFIRTYCFPKRIDHDDYRKMLENLSKSEDSIKRNGFGIPNKCYICSKLNQIHGKSVLFKTKRDFFKHVRLYHSDYSESIKMKKLPKPTNKVIKDVVPSSFSTAITKSVIPIDDPSPSSSSDFFDSNSISTYSGQYPQIQKSPPCSSLPTASNSHSSLSSYQLPKFNPILTSFSSKILTTKSSTPKVSVSKAKTSSKQSNMKIPIGGKGIILFKRSTQVQQTT
ncbi:uncharacterized protein LOC124496717 [Dermatophagoides farinae]|uniref:uncharacterized protein LOC124496717 n=1 Tax=Dermatophagoides farinae TaxID=6954 RepID=UPI003F5E1017